jgi:hypothetical protein
MALKLIQFIHRDVPDSRQKTAWGGRRNLRRCVTLTNRAQCIDVAEEKMNPERRPAEY